MISLSSCTTTRATSCKSSPLSLRGSATAPYETIAPGLEAAISKNASDLLNCFGARGTGRPFEVASGDLVCKVVNEPARGLLRVEGSAGVSSSRGPEYSWASALQTPCITSSCRCQGANEALSTTIGNEEIHQRAITAASNLLAGKRKRLSDWQFPDIPKQVLG